MRYSSQRKLFKKHLMTKGLRTLQQTYRGKKRNDSITNQNFKKYQMVANKLLHGQLIK